MNKLTPATITARIDGHGVRVQALDGATLHYLTGSEPALAPNTMIGEDPSFLWLAPDRVLRVAFAPAPSPTARFTSDITGGLAIFAVSGANAKALLAIGCSLDLPVALAPGRCAQSVFAGVRATLYAAPRGDGYRLHVDRALAAYMLEWFARAVASFGPEDQQR